jgi:uncharacterized protein (DUF342 family)
MMDGPKVELKVDSDKLNAFIVINNPDISENEIRFVLESGGIKFGILDSKIKEIVKKVIVKEPLLIAQGVPPVNGEDAKILYNLEEGSDERRPIVLDDGSVDYKDVKSFRIVKENEIMAVKVPATEGKDGEDIFGNVIPSKNGKDLKLVAGKNAKVSDDGLQILSTKNGIPLIHDNVLEVSELLEIKGNIDYSIGNVDFPGDVEIRGNVTPTFYVRATGNIKIKGVIEGATVTSDSNVECLGVKGRGKGLLSAKGNVKAKFLENAHVECDGELYIEGSIVNSTVRAGKKIEVTGGVGQIVGSNVISGLTVIAKEIGSEMAISTHIEVGIDPKTRDRITELSSKIYIQKQNLEKIATFIKLLEDLKKKNNGILSPDKEQNYDRAKKTRFEIYKSLSEMIEEVKALQTNLETYAQDSRVIALSKIYPSVEIIIGGKRILIDKMLGPSIIKLVKEEIDVLPYLG